MNMKKLRILFLLLTVACLAFIWVNSSFDAEESSGISGGVLGIINNFIMRLGFKKEFSEHLIRKSAHFTEYAGLSFLIKTDFKLFCCNMKKHWDRILFSGLLVAIIDETIQIFPAGRSSKVIDIWIDFGGVCFAFVITMLIYAFLEKRNIISFK